MEAQGRDNVNNNKGTITRCKAHGQGVGKVRSGVKKWGKNHKGKAGAKGALCAGAIR